MHSGNDSVNKGIITTLTNATSMCHRIELADEQKVPHGRQRQHLLPRITLQGLQLVFSPSLSLVLPLVVARTIFPKENQVGQQSDPPKMTVIFFFNFPRIWWLVAGECFPSYWNSHDWLLFLLVCSCGKSSRRVIIMRQWTVRMDFKTFFPRHSFDSRASYCCLKGFLKQFAGGILTSSHLERTLTWNMQVHSCVTRRGNATMLAHAWFLTRRGSGKVAECISVRPVQNLNNVTRSGIKPVCTLCMRSGPPPSYVLILCLHEGRTQTSQARSPICFQPFPSASTLVCQTHCPFTFPSPCLFLFWNKCSKSNIVRVPLRSAHTRTSLPSRCPPAPHPSPTTLTLTHTRTQTHSCTHAFPELSAVCLAFTFPAKKTGSMNVNQSGNMGHLAWWGHPMFSLTVVIRTPEIKHSFGWSKCTSALHRTRRRIVRMLMTAASRMAKTRVDVCHTDEAPLKTWVNIILKYVLEQQQFPCVSQ